MKPSIDYLWEVFEPDFEAGMLSTVMNYRGDLGAKVGKRQQRGRSNHEQVSPR